MATKILWLDTETTGLNAWKNDVIQIAGMVEIGGKILEEFNFTCRPHDINSIEEAALKVHGMTVEQLDCFESPLKVCNKFCRILDSYIDKFDKTDKFVMAGYNVGFDFDMMKSWWGKCDFKYFGSYFEYKQFDVYPLVFMYADRYGWNTPDHKLETMCQFLDIQITAHDALSDIRATRDLYLKLSSVLPEEWRD